MRRQVIEGVAVALVLAAGGWWYFHVNKDQMPEMLETYQLATYHNAKYGFSFSYRDPSALYSTVDVEKGTTTPPSDTTVCASDGGVPSQTNDDPLVFCVQVHPHTTIERYIQDNKLWLPDGIVASAPTNTDDFAGAWHTTLGGADDAVIIPPATVLLMKKGNLFVIAGDGYFIGQYIRNETGKDWTYGSDILKTFKFDTVPAPKPLPTAL